MLVAAPESSCGVVGEDEAEVTSEPLASLRGTAPSTPLRAGLAADATWVAVAPAKSCRAALGPTGSETRSHTTSAELLSGRTNASAATQEAVAPAKSDCWRSSGLGMYSVAGVSSREVAKWEPMPVAFSAAETIH